MPNQWWHEQRRCRGRLAALREARAPAPTALSNLSITLSLAAPAALTASTGGTDRRGGGVAARPSLRNGELINLVDGDAEGAVNEGVSSIGTSYRMVIGLNFEPFSGMAGHDAGGGRWKTLELHCVAEEGE